MTKTPTQQLIELLDREIGEENKKDGLIVTLTDFDDMKVMFDDGQYWACTKIEDIEKDKGLIN